MDEQGLKSTSEMTRSLKQKLKKYGLALKKRAIGVGPDPDPSQSNREGTVDLEEKIEFTEPIDVNVEEKLESTEPIDVDVEETEVVDKMMVEENCKWVRLSGNSEKVDQGANSATIFKEPVANPAPASSTNTNFIEIAKKRGLTFDRPRWWPSDEVIARDWKRRLAGNSD
ncbi:uncharacterized protein LOC108208174 isoform X2 [Daucus carota subsp. sativus]|uniref:uncharacterized protein LOC108208174 isoform X2 n=1 Tax=Daucus carota subsp. sativus TaxID=79200 RepID=UPI0007F01066|nr:PREDICTED: uncharacterized protein LOC108208174 isoform X2 [Daucus carota subsp. sativus]